MWETKGEKEHYEIGKKHGIKKIRRTQGRRKLIKKRKERIVPWIPRNLFIFEKTLARN